MKRFTSIIIIIVLISTVIGYFCIRNNTNSFDKDIYRTGGVYRHLDELTSEKYKGRLTGSGWNWDAIRYIERFFREIGLDPAGEDGSYIQEFRTLVPDVGSEPSFTVKSGNGETLMELEMYKDYRAVTSFNSGGIHFDGELIFVKTNLMRLDPALYKDRIVVSSNLNLTADMINHVLESGGKGLLNNSDELSYAMSRYHEREKDVSIWYKTGPSIFAGHISNSVYRDLLELSEEYESDDRIKPSGILSNVEINVDIGYPIVETANVLGSIKGKSKNGRILMISAGMDGAGEGIGDRHFPGAISNTTGLAVMLEVARVTASQDNLPYQTIVFVAFNGQKQQFSGSEFYIEHPLYPPEKTTLIHLDDLGYKTPEGLKISSESIVSGILKDKMSNYAKDTDVRVSKTTPVYGPVTRFTDYGAEAVLLGDIFYMQDSHYDVSGNVDRGSLQNAALVLLNYLQRETYRDVAVDYLGPIDYVLLVIMILLILVNFMISRLYKTAPGMKLGKRTVENIYFSTPVSILRKGIQILLPVGIAVFMLVFLANISPDTTAGYREGALNTNFSWYITLKKSLMYLKGAGGSAGKGVAGILAQASLRSLGLMVSSLVLSTAIGIATGMLGAYRTRSRDLRSMGSLIIFSIPDVLVVLAGVLLFTTIAKAVGFDSGISVLKKFLFPLITLSVMPSIYITRMTYIAVLDELMLDYVRNARAKGLSRRRIFVSEILPAVIFKTIDSLPAIMTMMFSNMIIVEYLFNYLGILHYLIYFYNRQNVSGFVGLALTLGVIFIILTQGVQFAARYFNPLKRRVVK